MSFYTDLVGHWIKKVCHFEVIEEDVDPQDLPMLLVGVWTGTMTRKQFGVIFEHLYTCDLIVQLHSRFIPVEILVHVQQETCT